MARRLALALTLVVLAGCATLFSSGPTDIGFGSQPEAAQVIVNGESLGTTPVTLQLEANESYVITFRKEGCADATAQLQTHVQVGWVILDLFAPFGIIVDLITGEWKEFNDKSQYMTLDCGE